ncbi:pilus assembly protein PilQ, partial [Aeromonas hydrophila]
MLVSLGEGASTASFNAQSALLTTAATPASTSATPVTTSALINSNIVASSQSIQPQAMPVASTSSAKPVLNNYQNSGGGAYFNT